MTFAIGAITLCVVMVLIGARAAFRLTKRRRRIISSTGLDRSWQSWQLGDAGGEHCHGSQSPPDIGGGERDGGWGEASTL